MIWLAAILGIVLIGQIVLFLYSRRVRREMKNSVIEKYALKTPKDAWEALANPEIPEEDRKAIKRLYEGNNS